MRSSWSSSASVQPWLWALLISCSAFTARSAELNEPLRDEDLVIVMGSCAKRLLLAQTSTPANSPPYLVYPIVLSVVGTCRNCRLLLAQTSAREARGNATGIRIVYGLDNSTLAEHMQQHVGAFQNESYVWWPDRPPSLTKKTKKVKSKRLVLPNPLPGDSRVSMMPWLAHKALQGAAPYKWMLYGDDGEWTRMHAPECTQHATSCGTCSLPCNANMGYGVQHQVDANRWNKPSTLRLAEARRQSHLLSHRCAHAGCSPRSGAATMHADTFFFLHGVRELLRSYDHSLPYVISGNTKRRRASIGRLWVVCMCVCVWGEASRLSSWQSASAFDA